MTRLRFTPWLPILLLAIVIPVRAQAPANAPAPGTEVQFPYVFRDDGGTALSVAPDGSVTDENGELFRQGGQLIVGENFQYSNDQGRATLDARRNELMFPPAPGPGVTVSRRLSLDAQGKFLRYVELLENPGGEPAHARVRVHFDFAGPPQAVERVGDERRGGSPVGLAVSDGEKGIALLGAGRSTGARGVRPQLVNHPETASADMLFELDVPPHRTVGLVHFVAVRPSQGEAINFLRSSKDADLLKGLAPELLRLLANFSLGERLVGDLEVLRGELFDVVELRGGDVYKGTLRQASYSLQTPYGPVELPADRVVAMVTLGQFRPTQLLVTADGEVFGGTLKGDSIKLELSSGQVTAVPLSGVRRFGYRKRAGEGDELKAPAGKPLVMLRSGDRVAVEMPAGPLAVATCYGVLRLDPRTVASVAFQSEEHSVHEVRLVDGSHFAGVVAQEKFDVKLAGAGAGAGAGGAGGAGSRAASFPASSVARLQFAPDVEDPGNSAPQLLLSNGDVLIGSLAGKLVLETAFDAIEVEAEGLRSLKQGTGGDESGAGSPGAGGVSPSEVQLTLWDGTTLSGRVRGDAIDCTLKCGAAVKVPVAVVKQYTQPSPRPAPQVVERIKGVVEQLNAPDWKARDRAAAQLASIGPAAAAVLKDLRENQPPEVRQRIDQILAGFEQNAEREGAGAAVQRGAREAPVEAEIDRR